MALHAKAHAEGGYRFYAQYDKMHREDILAQAYAQYRSNKDPQGVDGQDLAEIGAYDVRRRRTTIRSRIAPAQPGSCPNRARSKDPVRLPDRFRNPQARRAILLSWLVGSGAFSAVPWRTASNFGPRTIRGAAPRVSHA
jgi:hypothetical protein